MLGGSSPVSLSKDRSSNQHPNSESAIKTNHEVLASVIGSHDGVQDAALHHYTKTFRGFSAMLTPDQAAKLAGTNIASGGAISAPLAIYKACWFNLCSDADVLAALDDATNDGVDIISMSPGPYPPQPIYFENAISNGSFHAFQKGIVISASTGNSFFPSTATNVREMLTDNLREKGIIVKQGGGVGIILIDQLAKDIEIQFVLPGTLIGQEEGAELQAYMTAQK
ncbi:unnamed protein product [Fraxinus pennsylvanica]|uniref:Uncharacterized protein n=1 Tax=Fraxinus pennsylvanica TaxID=56036 RepID=A0AAD2E8C9_9LAMI|nr:unnamed protein product [Fraxinus pennsylvanica]